MRLCVVSFPSVPQTGWATWLKFGIIGKTTMKEKEFEALLGLKASARGYFVVGGTLSNENGQFRLLKQREMHNQTTHATTHTTTLRPSPKPK